MAIDWRNEPVIDSVQLPGSETKYWVQDTEAREKIETLANATHFIGVSTTKITDEGIEKPTINGEEVNPVAGDIVIWKPLTGAPLEFIWDGSKWNLLGGQALEGLGDLAFKDSAEGSYTPEGSVTLINTSTQSSFSTVVTDVNFGSIETTATVSFTSSQSTGWGQYIIPVYDDNFTIILPSSVELSTESITFSVVDGVNDVITYLSTSNVIAGTQTFSGTLPTMTASSQVTASISGTTLVFSLENLGFNAGAFPTYSFNTINSIVDYSRRLAIETTDVTVLSSAQFGFTTSEIYYVGGIESTIYYSATASTSASLNVDVVPVDLRFSGESSTITVS